MKEFRIHEPQSVQEASNLLAQFGWDAALYAGGTELLILMREGLSHYPHLINIKRISGLDEIRMGNDGTAVRIGAAATHHSVECSEVIAKNTPFLADVESMVGNIRVRVSGTIGGNLCFAEPRSDIAVLFVAWPGATYELGSSRGVRTIQAPDFNNDLFFTIREDDEIMTAVNLPILASNVGGAYEKFATLERPTANVAVILAVHNGRITSSTISVGSVGAFPYLASEAMALLQNQAASEELFDAAAEAAAKSTDPVDDIYGSAQYKRQLVRVLTKRALQNAVTRAKGKDVWTTNS